MKISPELRKKIKDYSAVAAGLLAMPAAANAQVAYHDYEPDLEIAPSVLGYFNLDLNGDGVDDFRIEKDFRQVSCTTFTWSSSTSQWCYSSNKVFWRNLGSGNSIEGPVEPMLVNTFSSFQDPIDPTIELGDTVSAEKQWNSLPKAKIGFDSQGGYNTFIGFRIKNGADYNYGWLRLYHDYNSNEIRVKDYSIEQTPNIPIIAGDGHDCNNFKPYLSALTPSCGVYPATIDVFPKREEYLWHGPGNVPSSYFDNSYMVFDAGFYYVVGEDGFGCVDTSNKLYLNIPLFGNWSGPVFSPASLSLSNDTLVASAGYEYQWYKFDKPIAEYSNKYLPDEPGIYKVRIVSPANCEITKSISYYNCAVDTIALTNIYPEACDGNLVLTNEHSNYIWLQSFSKNIMRNGASVAPDAAQTQTGSYLLTIFGNNGCTDSSPPLIVTTVVTPAPTITQSGDTLICSPADSYQWMRPISFFSTEEIPGATNSFFIPTTNGSYYVVVTDSGMCHSVVSNEIDINSCDLIANSCIPAAGSSVCSGSYISVVYDAPNTVFSLVKNNTVIAFGPYNDFYVPDSGLYSIIISNSINGCFDTITGIQVLPNPPPPQITEVNDTLCCNCPGQTQWYWQNTLIAGATNSWYALPDTTQPNDFYKATCTDSNQCHSVASAYYHACDVNIYKSGSSWCGAFNGGLQTNWLLQTDFDWYRNDSLVLTGTDQYETFTEPGTYYTVAYNTTGCIDTSNSIVLSVYPPPTDTAIQIIGDSIFTNVGGGTYEWRFNSNYIPGATNQYYIVDRIGEYRVSVTTDSGCSFTSLPVLLGTSEYCGRIFDFLNLGDTVYTCSTSYQFSAQNPYISHQLQWKRDGVEIQGATNSNYNAHESGTYRIIEYQTVCCADTSFPVTLIFMSLPAAAVITLVNDTLFSSPASNYQWLHYGSTIAGATNNFYYPPASGNYSVRVCSDSGCFSVSNQLSAAPFNISNGGTTGNQTYFNQPSASNQSINCDSTLQLQLEPIYNCNTHHVFVYTNFSAVSYEWYLNNVLYGTGYPLQVNDTGYYHLIATLSNGCVYYSDTVLINSATPFVQPFLYTSNDSLIAIPAPGISSVYWTVFPSYGQTFLSNDLNLIPTSDGIYRYYYYDSYGCQVFSNPDTFLSCNDSVHLIYTNDTLRYCGTTNQTFSVSSSYHFSYLGVTYKWYKDNILVSWANGSSINVSQGDYFVKITKPNGCVEYSDTVHFTVIADTLPVVSLTVTGDTLIGISNHPSSVLQWTYHDGYDWSSSQQIIAGATNQHYIPFYFGYYTVIATDLNGCSASTSLKFPPCSHILLTNACGAIDCSLSPATLITQGFAGSWANYHWYYNGNLINTPMGGHSIDVNAAGNYQVIHYNSDVGCYDTSNVVTISGFAPPSFTIHHDTLVSSVSLFYQWFENGDTIAGATNQQYIFVHAGFYTVSTTDSTGCELSSLQQFACSADTAIVTSAITSICSGDTIYIHCDLSYPAQFIWQHNGSYISGFDLFDSIPVFQGGSYDVYINDTLYCTGISNSITITVNIPPVVSISVSNDSLSAFPVGAYQYQWYFGNQLVSGATNQVYVAAANGNYTVAVTNTNNCTDTASVFWIYSGVVAINNFSINIYPNPSKDIFNLFIGNVHENINVSVYDLLGKEVVRSKVNCEKNSCQSEINLEGFPSGVYDIILTSFEFSKTMKLILIRDE